MNFIIWAIDDFNALSLIRQLGQCDNANILFLIIGKKKYAYKSKYVTKYVETKNLYEGLDYLKANFSSSVRKPVLFTSGDNVMVFLDNHREELDTLIYTPGCVKSGDTEFYTDKYNMWSIAKKVGMVTPACFLISKSDCENLPNISFPCLIKPSHETPGLYNEFKYRVCRNKKELIHTLKYVRNTSCFVVQDYIECENQLLVYGCRTPQKKTVICGSMLVDRYSETGSSSHGIIRQDMFGIMNENLITRFLDEIDYVGLFSFEFGVLNKIAYFFEINLRNDGTSNFFFQSGANAPLYLAYSFLDMDSSEISIKCNEGMAIDDLYDYENVVKKRITKKEHQRDLENSSYFKYYDSNDVEPYLEAKKSSKKQINKDIFLKKHRLFIVYLFSKLGLKK